jgi:hypothetical protein
MERMLVVVALVADRAQTFGQPEIGDSVHDGFPNA